MDRGEWSPLFRNFLSVRYSRETDFLCNQPFKYSTNCEISFVLLGAKANRDRDLGAKLFVGVDIQVLSTYSLQTKSSISLPGVSASMEHLISSDVRIKFSI